MTSRHPWIVCYAGDNYWFSNPHSRYHLMHALHRSGHSILWVNSFGMNMPKVRRRGFTTRVLLRIRSWLRWLRRARPGFWVLSPIALPLFGNRRLEVMNDRWISLQVRLAQTLCGIGRPIVFASVPSYAGVVAQLPNQGVIYYYSDKYVAYRDITAKDAIAAYDARLLAMADVVLCASYRVYESTRTRRPRVYYLPHAVDVLLYQAALDSNGPPPADLASIPRPWIGYFGSLTDSNDQELIRYAAETAPDLHFVLIGRVLGDWSTLQALPNVHFLGFKPYEQIPGYGKHFDVAFMSWKVTDWIRHSNPLKTKEYLYLGLPVVSIPIDEIERDFADVVRIAASGPEFLAAIQDCLREDSSEQRQARRARVREDSWDHRADEMMRSFREARGD